MSKYSNNLKNPSYRLKNYKPGLSSFKEYLNLSILRNDSSKVEELLKQEENLSLAMLDKKFLPLHTAAEFGSEEILEKLVESVSTKKVGERALSVLNTRNSTPLYMNAIDIADSDGNTPIHIAIMSEKLASLKVLIAGGVELNILNNEGRAPIHVAALYNFPEAVKCLIEGDAKINIKTAKGDSSLNISVVVGNEEIIKYLTMHGADINDSTSEGDTPLHLAVRENPSIVPYLVSCHAKVDVINAKGHTLIDSARQEKNEKIASFLEYSSAAMLVDPIDNILEICSRNKALASSYLGDIINTSREHSADLELS